MPCAIEDMNGLLRSPNGLMVITFLLGYNSPYNLLQDGTIQFPNQHYLKRVTKDNKWEQTSWEDVEDSQYGRPFARGNGSAVALFEINLLATSIK